MTRRMRGGIFLSGKSRSYGWGQGYRYQGKLKETRDVGFDGKGGLIGGGPVDHIGTGKYQIRVKS